MHRLVATGMAFAIIISGTSLSRAAVCECKQVKAEERAKCLKGCQVKKNGPPSGAAPARKAIDLDQ
jgi:hypothetical protein